MMYYITESEWERIPEQVKEVTAEGIRICPECYINRNAPYIRIYENDGFCIVPDRKRSQRKFNHTS